MSMKNENILVTGATGFIGGHIIRALQKHGVKKISALVRNTDSVQADALRKAGVHVLKGNMMDTASLNKLMKGKTAVVHAAAVIADSKQALIDNPRSVRNIINAAIQHKVSRVVFLSSIAVYGPSKKNVINENSSLNSPHDNYAQSKLKSEEEARKKQKEMKTTILRLGNVYGPTVYPNIGNPWTTEMISMVSSRRIPLAGSGKGTFNAVYVKDAASAVVSALAHNSTRGKTYNIIGTITTWGTFINYYVKMLARAGRPTNNPIKVPTVLSYIGAYTYPLWKFFLPLSLDITMEKIRIQTRKGIISNEKFRKDTGWKPEYSLEKGMSEIEKWLKKTGRMAKK